jgi:hypothetical protein
VSDGKHVTSVSLKSNFLDQNITLLIMLSYILPVEEKTQSSRNLSLNLNIQTTSQSQSCIEQDHDDYMNENSKLLNSERQSYSLLKVNGNGSNSGGNKTNYNMNITNNNVCNNLMNSSTGQSFSINKSEDLETESLINEYNVNNNEDINSANDKKIIKMSKLGSKNVTLKR